VDVIAETPAGDLVGIEIKTSASVAARDFRGLRPLRALVGDRLRRGIVLHTGEHTVPFGDGLFAVPVHALWSN